MNRVTWHSFVLAIHLARRDQADRFAGSVLGSTWTVIQPLVMVLIYTLVFGKLMGARLGESSTLDPMFGYGIYVLSGALPWNAMANSLLRGASVFSDQKALVHNIGFPMELLPLIVLFSETIPLFIGLLLTFGFIAITGSPFSWAMLLVVPVYLLQLLCCYGAILWLASLNVFLRDFKEAVSVSLQILFWFTPIVYVIDILPDRLAQIQLLSPLFWMVDSYHKILVHGTIPSSTGLMVLAGTGMFLSLTGYTFFRRLERDIRDFC